MEKLGLGGVVVVPMVRVVLMAVLATCVVALIAQFPEQAFQIVATGVIILSTASTLVFFVFAIRGIFVNLNERSREGRPTVTQMHAPNPVREEIKAPPLQNITQS